MSEFMSIAGEILQILLGVIAVIGGIIKLGPEISKAIRENKEYRQTRRTLDPEETEGQMVDVSKLFDLAFLLLCSAFFSLVLINALLVSGRSLDDPFSSAIGTLVITAVTTSTLIFAWYRGKSELGIGWWAILTFAMLVIAPGGAFFPAKEGSVEGIDLWVSLLTLAFLSLTMWVYQFGHPLDNELPLGKRLQVSAVVIVIITITILSLGRQFQVSVQNDARAPDLVSIADNASLERINNWDIVQNRTFYAAISDIYLAEFYRQNSNVVHPEIQFDPDSSDLDPIEQQRRADVISWFVELGLTEEEVQTHTNEMLFLFKEEDPLNAIREYFREQLYVNSVTANRFALEMMDISRKTYYRPRRDLRLEQILDYFAALDRQDQRNYLANRLTWIHAVSADDREQSPINLPGITPEERIRTLSEKRIRHALSQNSQRNALLAEFEFGERLEEELRDQPNLQFSFISLANPVSTNDAPERSDVFPDLGTHFYVSRLQEQLSLPLQEESYLAFTEYTILARDLLKSSLETKGVESDAVEGIFEDFDNLDSRTEDAFLRYVIRYSFENQGQVITGEDNFKAILALKPTDILSITNENRSDEVREVVIRLEKLETDPKIDGSDRLWVIARSIYQHHENSASTRENIVRFLRIQDPDFPIHLLLDEEVFELVEKLDRELKPFAKTKLFDVINNPIKQVIPDLIAAETLMKMDDFPESITDAEKKIRGDIFLKNAEDAANAFSELNHSQQRAFLHQQAILLYRAQGGYSLDFFSLMVWEASRLSNVLGLLVAALIVSPVVFMTAAVASYASRRLIARDTLRDVMIDEAGQSRAHYALGTTDILRGRGNVIARLKGLAGRGWSSIAIVGRRGVGKTRILYELMRSDQSDKRPSTVTAWISAPSSFTETEFVESVFERLTADVENVIAGNLGAKPLEVRRLETRFTLVGLVVYMVFLLILAVIFAQMSSLIASGHIVNTWFPIFAVFGSSLVIVLVHITKIQPVDLSPWLERDRSSSPHTVLLYREARQARAFLDARKTTDSGHTLADRFTVGTIAKLGAIVILGAIFFYAVSEMLGPSGFSLEAILIALSSSLLMIGLILFRTGKARVVRSHSLMSLISAYREFVEKTVYRIREGALKERSDDDFEVVVCIDELDKIVDPDELRVFLRRIKVIFEIPGAYYYLSLSEDALNSIYLGAAEGKNEIDSTFDHIVRVSPVDCDLGEKIAGSYIEKHSRSLFRVVSSVQLESDLDSETIPVVLRQQFKRNLIELSHNATLSIKDKQRVWLITSDEETYVVRKAADQLIVRKASKLDQIRESSRVDRSIAAISYGVPRDIVRRCDELLAKDDLADLQAWSVSDELRQKQAALAFGENLITSRDRLNFSNDAEKAVEATRKFLDDEPDNVRSARIVLSLWVLSLISLAVELSEEDWVEWSEKLRDIGYRIPDEPAENLVGELRDVHDRIRNLVTVHQSERVSAGAGRVRN